MVCIQTARSQADGREGRGLEDTGIGYCHTQGVGWNGNLTVEEIVEFEANSLEPDTSPDSISSDPKHHLIVYWSRLVQNPKCVDKLEISFGSGVHVNLMDPADFVESQNKVRVLRNVCETETLNIKIHNKRGGFNANVNIGVNVNVVKRKPDENFEWNGVLQGIIDNSDLFINNETDLQIVNKTDNGMILVWNKDIFVKPEMRKCLTSAELVDQKGNITNLDINSKEVAIDKSICVTVKYKYKGKTFLTRRTEDLNSNCLKIKPTIIQDKEIIKTNKTKEMEEVANSDEELTEEVKTTGLSSTHLTLVILLILVILGVALALVLYNKKYFSQQGGYQLEVSEGGEGGADGTGGEGIAGTININHAMEEEENQTVNFSIEENENQNNES